MRLTPLLLASCACLLALATSTATARAQQAPNKPKPGKAGKPAPTAAVAPEPPAKPPVPPDVVPPPPPPWTSPGAPSASTSGTSLMPEAAPTTTSAPAPTGVSAGEAAALEARIRTLEARLANDEANGGRTADAELAWLKKLHLSGFVQPQLLVQSYNTAASPNLTGGVLPPGVSANDALARSNGTTTNGDYFRLRRARLMVELAPSEGSRFVFEIDPTAPGGQIGQTGTILRQVEAQGIVHWSPTVTTELAAGIFKLPFGYEVLQYDADRPFIERSWGEQNMMPGEYDTGARAYTTWTEGGRSFGLQVAVVNGQTEGEPTFSLDPDLNRAKDFVGRMYFDFGDWAEIGASGYYGIGQTVNAAELEFKQFTRWAGNGEINLHHTFSPKVGATKIFAEATFAQDMDRGVIYAFAVPTIPSPIAHDVTDLHERNLWVRLEQDLSEWATLGLRWDEYTPNVSLGQDARDTFGVVGVAHFTPWLQMMLEYDHAIDHVHPTGAPAPDRQIDVGSAVLQARF
jgi:hypothetical protein